MSTVLPILKFKQCLITSIHRHLEDEEVSRFQDELLEKVGFCETRYVVIDVSALEIVDTYMTRVLSGLGKSCWMMGSRLVLCGLQPEVAITMVEMRQAITNVQPANDLEHALEIVEADAFAAEGGSI
ncbi:STAS domain-containing protein [Pelagicoccus sp. SDUM812003]|uniref:STAS domain-containing protein n=1 Tax=Pelagicoccus sp. SDUM812003 TaxID=3041267 RepID=UPI00280EA8CB|nr:STAS domain-containing protein [Pelagicoccus sp. SDUM812003]MDQ8204342.1 STAS domain-containing protein [Pelagicoccus sp. SDUM812003]